MLANGLSLVIERALAEVTGPGAVRAARRHRKALLLGALREDVARVPFATRVFDTFRSATSAAAGGRAASSRSGQGRASRWPRSSRRAPPARAGARGAAFVSLGRACHVLTDMACPRTSIA